MKREFTMGLLLSALMLLVSAGVCRSQEAPEPPEPPDEPEVEIQGLLTQAGSLEGAAWLGVTLHEVTAEKARELKLPGEYGALVEHVNADSAAAKAGLQKGDVIVEFAGERVRSEAQLRRLIRETPAGRTVSIQVIRDGQARTLSAKLQHQTAHFWAGTPEIHIPEININPGFGERLNPSFSFMFDKPTLGITGDELTSQLASYFGVKQGKGVLVSEVVMGSPAAKAGLKAGDVIVAVDGKEVATVGELRKALELKSGEDKRNLNLTVVRDHREQTIPVEVERPGLGEGNKEVAGLGFDSHDWQRVEAQAEAQMAAAKKQMANAQLALQEAQKQLHEKQALMSEQVRRAVEKYQQAIREQIKERLDLQIRKQIDASMPNVSL